MTAKDPLVGVLRDDEEKPVFQCRKTGLLYVWDQPPKRYVSVMNVQLERKTKEPSNVQRSK